MKVITRSDYNRMFVERRCFVCDEEIPLSDGHHWKGLGILVHGRCNQRVKAAAQPGRPVREILAEIKNDPVWNQGR